MEEVGRKATTAGWFDRLYKTSLLKTWDRCVFLILFLSQKSHLGVKVFVCYSNSLAGTLEVKVCFISINWFWDGRKCIYTGSYFKK